MSDPRITHEAVLAVIYSRANRRRVIWSPSTALSAMGIERYPHLPQGNYRKMKKALQELCDAGLLVRRPKLHSNFRFDGRRRRPTRPVGSETVCR